jgi:hypothetical protein
VKLERALRVWSPWAAAESVRWLALTVFGLVTWVIGWWVASRKAAFGDQVPWAIVTVGGFIIVAFADVTWLLRARWTVARRTAALLGDFGATDQAPLDETPATRVLVGPGLRRMHRRGCHLAAGKDWRDISRTAAARDGREPCGACRP